MTIKISAYISEILTFSHLSFSLLLFLYSLQLETVQSY